MRPPSRRALLRRCAVSSAPLGEDLPPPVGTVLLTSVDLLLRRRVTGGLPYRDPLPPPTAPPTVYRVRRHTEALGRKPLPVVMEAGRAVRSADGAVVGE